MTPTTLAWLLLCTAAPAAPAAENPWGSGPEAPPPDEVLPPSTAPREPGATHDPLDVPARPPEPARPPLELEVLGPAPELRFSSARTREELLLHGALDLDDALVDVPGLWLSHEQAGATRVSVRGLSERSLAVTLDGVPLFDLAGLLPPLEELSLPGSARLSFSHGARARTALGGVAAGALSVVSGAPLREVGESLRMDGALGAGYGGPDLEKGAFAFVETGLGRALVDADVALLNREDQRLGRGALAQEPGGVLMRSGGSGGAVGARAELAPLPNLRVFTAWHSARAYSLPRPPGCSASNDQGRAADCTTTLERGLDLWMAGGDAALHLLGLELGVGARAHAQHGLALDERSGTSLSFAERARDEGVRAGAGLTLDARLPPIALWDVVEPRATLSMDGFADRLSSSYALRSLRFRDAEPPGEGLPDPRFARRVDGAVIRRGALGLELRAEGARSAAWLAGSLALGALEAPAVEGRLEAPLDEGWLSPSAELGLSARVTDSLHVGAALTHVQEGDDAAALLLGPELGASTPLPARPGSAGRVDDALELSLGWQERWAELELVAWGAQRAGQLVVGADPDDAEGVARLVPGRVQTAGGVEARGALRPGLEGLVARGAFGLVAVDDGGPLETRKPAAGTPNPQGSVQAAWDPPSWPFGVSARARFWLPEQRLSPEEERDELLCPERPSDDDLAAGVVQSQPCRGAPGAFLFDVGAHLDVGDFRVDALLLNLLDQQGALRGEPLGFGGASGRVLLTLRL